MKKLPLVLVLSLLMAGAASGIDIKDSEQPTITPAGGPPLGGDVQRTVTVQGVITTIDSTLRNVTIQIKKGQTMTFYVDDTVAAIREEGAQIDLGDLEVGNQISVKYITGMNQVQEIDLLD
jgi:hypothetical protein